ncbi:MAG: DNA-directed RNA polymerase subunit omega [Candidatus Marinimicrobia bacterium]|nr:DNA-directed RNA polymerase subunit omega [Candidatus Neomarinimicrobiota bacterium]MCF7829689.1 DNA-directed RNA polymerase subunit omega [Candidatus Neomarinimicrobiota bacterium]MCF7881639.1 DNA-directed RNA polymerase subunit omega [Candidatus Neomarinimicrobiota bacterium]
MAVETISFRDLEDQTTDTFEAIIIMAKRARQVNAERLAKMELPAFMEDTEDEEIGLDREDLEDVDFDGIEKATTFAIREMLTGDLTFRYKGEQYEETEEIEDGELKENGEDSE